MQADMALFGSPQLAETATTKQSTSGKRSKGRDQAPSIQASVSFSLSIRIYFVVYCLGM